MACMRDGFEQGRPLDNGRFITVKPLNHGSFGMVFAAKDTFTGQDVAIKCITKPGANTNCPATVAIDEYSEELNIHSHLPEHPNIVNTVTNFQTENHTYMVLELCSNGDLYEAIRMGKGPLETGHVRDFMLQLVSAVEHLHEHGVYHRDIKPENIFLTSDAAMKLGDFGLATTDTWSTEFAVGSDRYMAPEQYDAGVYGYGYCPAQADVWAIGIVLLNVLFQRNPFATPTIKDPLFDDFARDRQSLFDVFPNMSQDTYNVLQHSLTLDPSNRSLTAVKEALEAVVSFTTDDEALDDFCTDQCESAPTATAAREPLRTPSVTSPGLPGADSFPWSAALLKTPQKPTRQLSTIHDEDMDLFPASANNSEWQYVDADEASLSSNVDSGLGLSYKSTKSMKSMHSTVSSLKKPKSNFVGSLPISFSRPKTSPYDTSGGFSKSWSDLWDEEEEEEESADEVAVDDSASFEEAGLDIERASTVKPSTPQLQVTVDEGRESVTPRQAFASLDVNARSGTPLTVIESATEEPPAKTLPKVKSSSILDRWAALGNFRRARQEPAPAVTPVTAVATPAKTKYSDAFASFTPFGTKKNKVHPQSQSQLEPEPKRQRERAPSWRQGSPQRMRSSSFNGSKIWQEDKNWREHKHPPSPTKTQPMAVQHDVQRRRPEPSLFDDEFGYSEVGHFRMDM
ncbi:putative serine/threonine-protein kinase, active [Septoria linicola]|nr:putative serine/threonine-protein kinase, active [Septoria linicola]